MEVQECNTALTWRAHGDAPSREASDPAMFNGLRRQWRLPTILICRTGKGALGLGDSVRSAVTGIHTWEVLRLLTRSRR